MSDLIDRLTGQRTTWEPLAEDAELARFFTDAEVALQAFEELVAADPLPKSLLVVHGVGGIGKSSLLRMYRLSCYQRGMPVGLVAAEDAPSAVDVLATWAEDLAGQRLKLRTFAQTMDEYRALQAEVEAKASEVLKGAAGEAGKIAAKTAVEMAASALPVVGPFAAALGGAGAEAAVGWLRGVLKKPELELYLDPLKRLTDSFRNDVNRAAGQQRVVLMADTYEQMAGLDVWMRDLAQQLPDNLLLVISGRAVPEWDRAWPGWLGRARIVEVEEMTPNDQRTLVRRYYDYIRGGEPEPAQVEAIVQFSRGLPIAVTTVVRLWVRHGVEDFHAVKPQVVADLADRLLEGVPQEMRPAFEIASVLRYFNADSLAAMLDGADVDALYAELLRWPFVRPRREGLAVHDAMREMMNEALSVRAPERFRALQERAAAYYQDRRMEAAGDAQESVLLELLYHTLQIDEVRGIVLLEALFREAEQLSQRELLNKLLHEGSQHTFLDVSCRHRLQCLQAGMARDWSEQERLFRELLREHLDDTLRAQALRKMTAPLSYQGRGGETLPYLREALAICQREGDLSGAAWTRLELCWQVRDLEESRNHIDLALDAFRELGDEGGIAVAETQSGWNYLNRWQPAAAREAFYRGLEVSERLGNRDRAAFVKERIGQTYLIEGDFLQAIVLKEEALAAFEGLGNEWSIAWTLDELATCYSWTGQWELALQSLERAQSILGRWGDQREAACVFRQGDIYRKQGRLELALETYQRSLDMAPSQGTWSRQGIYAGLGYIHLAQSAFDDALADFQQAITEFAAGNHEFGIQAVGNSYLGDWHLVQGQAAEALEFYAICLETARAVGNHFFECLALVRMCQAHHLQGHLEQIASLVGQAEELGQRYGYFQLLADIHQLTGHISLDRTPEDSGDLAATIDSYSTSLKCALRYNRFKLDETVEQIISHCQEHSKNGHQVLVALHDFWQTGNDDEGTVLLEIERSARERQPGGGEPQVSVIDRIRQVLKQVEG